MNNRRTISVLAGLMATALVGGSTAIPSAQTVAGPGSRGNGNPQPSQATRCVFNASEDYGFASKQDCLAFFDAGGRMWSFVDDFSFASNPAYDRWGFPAWAYRRAEYGSPGTGVLLTDRRTLENGTRLQWDTPNAEFNVPLVGIYSNMRIGVMHPGRAPVSPLLSVVDWRAAAAGFYEVRVDLWAIDGSPSASPDIGWTVYRKSAGGLSALAGGTMPHAVGQHTVTTVFIPALLANDEVSLVIDPGSNPTVPESSNGDTVAFRFTVLRPGQ
jgi:hypothetical protein